MGRRSVAVLAMSGLVTLGAVGAVTPALAADATAVTGTAAGSTESWQVKAVRRLAESDPRPLVRIGAWQALLADDIDAAAASFHAPGGEFAELKSLAARDAEMNQVIIDGVLGSTTWDSYPALFAAATRAKSGTPTEQEEFVRREMAVAEAADTALRQELDAADLARLRADRDVMRCLPCKPRAPGYGQRAKAD